MYFSQVFICVVIAFEQVSSRGYGVDGRGIVRSAGGAVYGSSAGWYGDGMVNYRGNTKGYRPVAGAYGVLGGYTGAGITYGSGQEIFAPKPYEFNYEAPDGYGNSHFRQEQGDNNGNVQGSYGYTDDQGLYRQVEYVADAGGFRAVVRTNEPGTDGKESPADVNVISQPSPPVIQEQQYKRPLAYNGIGTYGPGRYGTSVLGGYRANTGLLYGNGAMYNRGIAISGTSYVQPGTAGVAPYTTFGTGAQVSGRKSGYTKLGGIGGNGLFAGIPRSISGKSMY